MILNMLYKMGANKSKPKNTINYESNNDEIIKFTDSEYCKIIKHYKLIIKEKNKIIRQQKIIIYNLESKFEESNIYLQSNDKPHNDKTHNDIKDDNTESDLYQINESLQIYTLLC